MSVYKSNTNELISKIKSGIIIKIDFPKYDSTYQVKILSGGSIYYDSGIISISGVYHIHVNIELLSSRTYFMQVSSLIAPFYISLKYLNDVIKRKKNHWDMDLDQDMEEDHYLDSIFKNLKIKKYGCRMHDDDKGICEIYQCNGD